MTLTSLFAADFDRQRCRLARDLRERVVEDDRRIIVSGASGWIGRTVLSLLYDALGPVGFARRVACFGSSEKIVRLIDGAPVRQAPLSALADAGPRRSLMFHLAFLTKDKIGSMDDAVYVAENRRVSRQALAAAEALGVDRVFVASSGAACFADDAASAKDLRLYGRLKREEEALFAAWALAAGAGRRVAIARIFSVSGPFINKIQTYALASFINDALAGRPISVAAQHPVFRSYVAVRDVIALTLSCLLTGDDAAGPVLRFETGGKAIEVGELASSVAGVLGSRVDRALMTEDRSNSYCGDDAAWQALLQRYAVAGTSLDDQIIETAAYMSRELRGREAIAQIRRFC